ncbi:hypothetical protein [Orbus mooreae]|uniref:hypothetical protein n=1 Tax=Orbus mooreae TaxID=3074107 RepID=UPI00370D0389
MYILPFIMSTIVIAATYVVLVIRSKKPQRVSYFHLRAIFGSLLAFIIVGTLGNCIPPKYSSMYYLSLVLLLVSMWALITILYQFLLKIPFDKASVSSLCSIGAMFLALLLLLSTYNGLNFTF